MEIYFFIFLLLIKELSGICLMHRIITASAYTIHVITEKCEIRKPVPGPIVLHFPVILAQRPTANNF